MPWPPARGWATMSAFALDRAMQDMEKLKYLDLVCTDNDGSEQRGKSISRILCSQSNAQLKQLLLLQCCHPAVDNQMPLCL
jgi:hypothetical protein